MPDMLRNAQRVEAFDPETPLTVEMPQPPRPEPAARAVREAGMRAAEGEPDIWTGKMRDIRDNRSEAAFVAVFEHFAPRVKAFLMKSGSDAALAEEIVQDVMTTVWRKSHLFDPARASVATWIFTIARNRRIDAIRKTRRPEPEDLPWGPDHAPEPTEVLGLQQDSARLAKALGALPDKQRLLVEKAYFGELSHSEIAAETGLPLGTIKSRIRLALDRLRHAMT